MGRLSLKKQEKTMQYFLRPEIRDQAHGLYQRGGPFQKASERVLAVIGAISQKMPNPLKGLKTTNYGETRIEKCVKYDLTSACRLVTVQNSGKIILLFVGDHEDEEKWLKSNRGNKFVVDNCGRIDELKIPSATLSVGERPEIVSDYTPGNLYELLSNSDFDGLVDGLSRSEIRGIELLHSFSSDDELFDTVDKIAGETKKNLILDVLIALKENDVDGALRRLAYENGELADLPKHEVLDSERIYSIPNDDPAYAELFTHFVRTADYKKWMLFLHPEQQASVEQDYSGSAKLLGVSGSGKTCVVVKRAIRLAEKYHGEEILIVTLNRSLARLIKELVDVVATDSVRKNIRVEPFYKICQEYLHEYEPGSDRLYDDTTWKSQEHIDEVWSEYYQCRLNNNDASILIPVHDYLIAQGVKAENYIREEFDWIRSAVVNNDRSKYLSIQRQGRSVPMQKDHRERLLKGLELWESKMRAVGLTDYLGLAAALSNHKDKLEPRYRCVLIDESQDFGTTELSIIRKITKPGENDVFICGDAAQRVSTKFQSLKGATVSVPRAHSKTLRKNYRNSREILSAAYKVLVNNLTEEVMDSEDFEVLDPEFSSFSSSAPLILKADNLACELAYAISHARVEIAENPSWKICIAICGFTLHEISVFGVGHDLTVLDGEASLGEDSLFISDLEQTKGFEFDVMIVMNASESVIPNPSLPAKEHFRESCHFYVALTRAKSELIVSYHDRPSVMLNDTDDVFLSDNWGSYLDGEDVNPVVPPKFIQNFSNEDNLDQSIIYMTAQRFLYTDNALGLSSRLILKLRELVSGTPLNREGHLVRWRNLGSAYDSTNESPRSRAVFGSEVIKEFRGLCEKIELPFLIKGSSKKELYRGDKDNDIAGTIQ